MFSLYRSLKCARITLHMNLFASFAANNFLWLIWYHVILDTNILEGKDQVKGLFENHFIMDVRWLSKNKSEYRSEFIVSMDTTTKLNFAVFNAIKDRQFTTKDK